MGAASTALLSVRLLPPLSAPDPRGGLYWPPWGLAGRPRREDSTSVGHPGLPLAPRHWQDLGYLIIYVTGRPDMQKQRVVAWLAQHNFPHGVVSFCDGLVHDPLRHKANFLKLLISEVGPG